jgi:hypothetical protein
MVWACSTKVQCSDRNGRKKQELAATQLLKRDSRLVAACNADIQAEAAVEGGDAGKSVVSQ